MQVALEASWKSKLADEFEKPYFRELAGRVRSEYEDGTVYPHPKNVFQAFTLTPFDDVRVIILGQDPYHGPHQAHGLAFSVAEGVQEPPSLVNIYKELESDIGKRPHGGNLENWARQGVLLLNAALTVRKGEAGSHQGLGLSLIHI